LRAGIRPFSEEQRTCQENLGVFSGYIWKAKSRLTADRRATYVRKWSGTSVYSNLGGTLNGVIDRLNPEASRRSQLMNPKTSAAKLDESLGIDGSGTGSGVGRLTEAYRLASELVDRPRGVSGTSGVKCPADLRIEAFLNDYFSDLRLPSPLRLPGETLVLPRHGLARLFSLPYDADIYGNDYVRSYRVRNGVLHNPKSDRRTTQGTFHVAEGGLPIPGDKKAVPRSVFAALFRSAVAPPPDLL